MPKNMSTFQQIYEFYETLLAQILRLASDLKFDAEHVLHLHAVALYGSIIELSTSLKTLYLSEHYSSLQIILRSLFEAHVDLDNLSKDPKHGYFLQLSYLEENMKLFKEAKNDQNFYMTIIAQQPDLDSKIDKFEKEITTLKCKGFKNLNISDKFKKANLKNEYKTFYNLLCSAAHNNFRSLLDRHVTSINGKNEVQYFKRPDFEELESWFGFACEIVLRSSFSIHGLLGTKAIPELQGLRETLNKLRDES